MVAPRYNRSSILNFNELTEDEQKQVFDDYSFEKSDAYDNSYVRFKYPNRTAILPLDMFMRFDFGGRSRNPIWDGYYGTSYFSGYFIKLSKCGSEALVAERYS